MLSKLSPIGSLVSDEVYLIWISNSISKEKISDRKEFYGITQNGLLFKGTIWTPPSGVKIEAQTWVKLLNFKVIDFKGKKLSSFGPSTIQPSISTKPRPEVKDIFGGIEYESTPIIRSKTEIGKPYWAHISGRIDAYDHSFTYQACIECRRKAIPDSKKCTNCGSTSFGSAFKATIYVTEVGDQICCPVTFFGSPIRILITRKIGNLCRPEKDRSRETGYGGTRWKEYWTPHQV